MWSLQKTTSNKQARTNNSPVKLACIKMQAHAFMRLLIFLSVSEGWVVVGGGGEGLLSRRRYLAVASSSSFSLLENKEGSTFCSCLDLFCASLLRLFLRADLDKSVVGGVDTEY